MTERPILFSAPMVRALLDGRKQQTRRIVKTKHAGRIVGPAGPCMAMEYTGIDNDGRDCFSAITCPYGQPGDRLWVRETWGYNPDHPGRIGSICYRADPGHQHDGISWKPSIHMRREASRITLEITAVRVERLQDISEADALAEGIARHADGSGFHTEDGRHYSADPSESFASLWESINGPGSWDANPLAWVVEFKRSTP